MAVEYIGENALVFQEDEPTYVSNGALAASSIFRRIAMNQTWLAVQDTDAINFFTAFGAQATPNLTTPNYLYLTIRMPPFSQYVEFWFLAMRDDHTPSVLISALSNGINITAMAGVINVQTSPIAAGFPATGALYVKTAGTVGVARVTYTALSAAAPIGFTGCAVTAGGTSIAGTMTTGDAVYSAVPQYIEVKNASYTRRNSNILGGSPSNSGKATWGAIREAEWVTFQGITGAGGNDDPTALQMLATPVNTWTDVVVQVSCTSNVQLYTGYYRVLPCTGPLSSWA